MATKTGDWTKAVILAKAHIDKVKLNKDLELGELKALKTAEEFTPTTAADWDGTITSQDDALDELASRVKDSEGEADDTATAIGITLGDTDIGNFSGAIISDGGTVAAGMQELETAVEANATAIGIIAGDTDIGNFSGSTISDGGTVVAGMQELETAVELKLDAASGIKVAAITFAFDALTDGAPALFGTAIPSGSQIVSGAMYVTAAFTGDGNGSSTIKVGIEDQDDDLMIAAAISGAPWSSSATMVTFTGAVGTALDINTPATGWVPTTADRQLAVTLTINATDTALTAGSATVYLLYI